MGNKKNTVDTWLRLYSKIIQGPILNKLGSSISLLLFLFDKVTELNCNSSTVLSKNTIGIPEFFILSNLSLFSECSTTDIIIPSTFIDNILSKCFLSFKESSWETARIIS